MKTYSRADYLRAGEGWKSFGPEWSWVRTEAQRWTIFPPSGTKHDDRDAPNPSQRAIVYRALAEQPTELRRILRRCRSWSEVCDAIFGVEARIREDAGLLEDTIAWEKDDYPKPREAMKSIAEIIGTMRDSLP